MAAKADPAGWHIIVSEKKVEDKTRGGIFLPDETKDVGAWSTVVCKVESMGKECYSDPVKFPNGPWCAVGDWILLPKFTGHRFKLGDDTVRLINDDQVLAVIDDPESVKSVT